MKINKADKHSCLWFDECSYCLFIAFASIKILVVADYQVDLESCQPAVALFDIY